MQNNVNKFARVSDIAAYYFCPRLTYFNLRKAHDPVFQEIRAEVLKSISPYLMDALASPTPEAFLEAMIGNCCDDAVAIYGSQAANSIESVRQELKSRIVNTLAGLRAEKQRIGERRLGLLLSPSFTSEAIYSDRLRISGTIDRIIWIDDRLMPMVISGSMPPPNGIYARDRVKLAAYSLLLAEKYQEPVIYGAVEYALGWDLRESPIRSEDKRKALYARNRILDMLQGKMPDAKRSKWCLQCEYHSSCNVKVSFLDSLFKK